MKPSNSKTNSSATKVKNFFTKAPLAVAMALATFGYMPSAQATDLDIYQGPIPVGGETSVMMLFDVSNNMGQTDSPSNWGFPYPNLSNVIPAGSKPVVPGAVSEFGANDTVYDFPRYYQIDSNGKFYYRRIDKLKMSLYHILGIQKMKGSTSEPLSENLSFGLSLTPSLDNDRTTIDKRNNSQKGYILVPAKPLNYVYPGSKTQTTMPMNDAGRNDIRKANLPLANPLSVYAGWTQKDRLHDAIRRLNADGNGGRGSYNPLSIGIMETSAYLLGTRTDQMVRGYVNDQFSGMSLSASDSKLANGYYKAPEAQGDACSPAKGVFVLSSGPGNVQEMNINTLATFSKKTIDYGYETPDVGNTFLACNSQNYSKATSVGNDGNSYGLTYSDNQDVHWMCGLPMTRILRGHNYTYNPGFKKTYELFGESYKSIPTLADKKMNILTGVVGFGSVMSTYKNSPKVKRYDQDGREVLAQDCSRGTLAKIFGGNMSDAIKYQNFCMLGAETYNWGEGGLYTAENPDEVSKALNTFISKIKNQTTELPSISTGTMSVPFDSLNQLTPRTSAYLPILDPKVNTTKFWPGNVKKYEIKNGTIVDGSDNKVFTSRDGYFAKNTKDRWNTGTTADEAKPQSGGVFEQILNGVTSTSTKNRKTFVDYNGSLKEVKVEGKSPQGFNALAWNTPAQVAKNKTELDEINSITDATKKANRVAKREQEMKYQLANFLGYPVTYDFTQVTTTNKFIKDGTALSANQTKDNRILGGVLHSRPQLITYDAVLNNDGSIKSRNDYVLYGSFDGALHLVDDSNGEEAFNFIPSQVLQRQGDAFVPSKKDTLGDPKAAPYLHGVDAEWTVYSDYIRKVEKKEYKLDANNIFAFGGLRMGGSMYYGLDLTDKSNPSMLYSVGSDYALSVGEGGNTANGLKNGQAESDFSRMGLTWGKPTVAYVKQGGKKVMVNILPGGYDECYEDPHFQLGSAVTTNEIEGCNGKLAAQGNAVYMVKVGEEEVDSKTNIAKIKTTGVTDIGSLMWWASSATAADNTVTDMKHSVVSQVLALDGNYDGLTDHLYFADLGGQVWRVDIDNTKNTDDFSVKRVVKIFDASGDAQVKDIVNKDSKSIKATYSPRFYETPLVTFERMGNAGKIFGLVTVGSGDRSNPLNLEFSNNHLYTIVDRDLARYRSELFCKNDPNTTEDECADITLYTQNVQSSDLGEISFDATGRADVSAATLKENFKKGVQGSGGVKGWKYKLDDSGFKAGLPGAPKGLKLFNRPDALNGQLFTSVFSPEKNTQGGECVATVTGQTKRERLCLPYGYCFNQDGTVANRFTLVGGGGIVDNYVSFLGGSSTSGSSSESKKVGVIDTYSECTGDDCRQEIKGKNPDTYENKLSKHNTEQSFNPLKWFDR